MMFAPLVDYVTGRVSAWRAKNSAAFVALTNPDTGVPYDAANPLPVGATVVMPTGLATSALQTTGNTSLSSIDTKTPALVTGRVPVDGSGVTQPVSAAALPLPTGAATETSLAAINGKFGSLGQKAMAASAPVVIASDQSAVPVSGPLTDAQLRATRVPVNSSVPQVASGTILSLTTNATGTTYTAFGSQACTALDIVNNTNTTIEYRRGGAGTAMQIPTGAARMVIGITNASQVDIRRTDTSNTTVTLQAEAFVI